MCFMYIVFVCWNQKKFSSNQFFVRLFNTILFEYPIVDIPNLDADCIGEDSAIFLDAALDAGLSIIIYGNRERGHILGSLSSKLRKNGTVVNIVCGPYIDSHQEREIAINYLTSSNWE